MFCAQCAREKNKTECDMYTRYYPELSGHTPSFEALTGGLYAAPTDKDAI